MGVVSGEEHVPFSSICARVYEQNCRFVIPPETGINRMDVTPRMFKQIVYVYRMPVLDMFAFTRNHQAPKYFSWTLDPQAVGMDAFSVNWNKGLLKLHVSSVQSDSKMSSKNDRRQGNCSFDNTSMAVKTMVFHATESPIRQAFSITTQSINIETAMVSNSTSSISEQEVSSSRLAFVRRSFADQIFSERVCKILQASWKPGK